MLFALFGYNTSHTFLFWQKSYNKIIVKKYCCNIANKYLDPPPLWHNPKGGEGQKLFAYMYLMCTTLWKMLISCGSAEADGGTSAPSAWKLKWAKKVWICYGCLRTIFRHAFMTPLSFWSTNSRLKSKPCQVQRRVQYYKEEVFGQNWRPTIVSIINSNWEIQLSFFPWDTQYIYIHIQYVYILYYKCKLGWNSCSCINCYTYTYCIYTYLSLYLYIHYSYTYLQGVPKKVGIRFF